MSKKVEIQQVTFITGLKCNMHCRACCYFVPYFKNIWQPGYDYLISTLDKLFAIGNYGSFQITGGEPFIRKDLPDMLNYALKYDSQVKDFWRLTTNCAVPLSEELLEVLRKFNGRIKVTLDDYGEYSPYFESIRNRLEANQVWVEIHSYHGNNQYYGGWFFRGISKGPIRTKEETLKTFKSCSFYRQIFVIDGKAVKCGYVYFWENLYKREPLPDYQVVELFEPGLSIDQIKEKVNKMYYGFNNVCPYHFPHSELSTKRIPAAVQLTKDEQAYITESNQLDMDEIEGMLLKEL